LLLQLVQMGTADLEQLLDMGAFGWVHKVFLQDR
jgi:hypothetical protein